MNSQRNLMLTHFTIRTLNRNEINKIWCRPLLTHNRGCSNKKNIGFWKHPAYTSIHYLKILYMRLLLQVTFTNYTKLSLKNLYVNELWIPLNKSVFSKPLVVMDWTNLYPLYMRKLCKLLDITDYLVHETYPILLSLIIHLF